MALSGSLTMEMTMMVAASEQSELVWLKEPCFFNKEGKTECLGSNQ